MFTPAGQGVCLHDQPPGVELVALQPGVQGVHGEHVAGGGVGVAPPVATGHLRPGQGHVMLCLPVLHVSSEDSHYHDTHPSIPSPVTETTVL